MTTMTHRAPSMLDPALLKPALIESLKRLAPWAQWRNPVMFVVWVGAALGTMIGILAALGRLTAPVGFTLWVAAWLWLTVWFANLAEALAEGRGKAQAAALRAAKKRVYAKVLQEPNHGASWIPVPSDELAAGKVVLVEAGDVIPADGEVIEGVASVDESAITGESAPVIRESGGDRSAVTGGTKVISDWVVVRITAQPGQTFLDRMISMVEGAKRRRTPNEIALTILLVALTLVFLIICVTLLPFSQYSAQAAQQGQPVSVTVLIALLVCLIPTTIGALLAAIGIAGMSRMLRANVIATSGRAVEAAGDVDVLLLDKTGTITLGNRQAVALHPAPGVGEQELADAAQLASLADETPEGRSIVVLAKQRFNLRGRDTHGVQFVAFSARTRMSGVDVDGRSIRKGAVDAIERFVREAGGELPGPVRERAEAIARQGGTPLLVAEGRRVLGVVELKDIVKGGIRERFAELRRMGIKTVMVTGDNRLTAAAIAAEAGVDDFLAEATPEDKLALIRKYQAEGHLVAMNAGTQAAKEAGNMVDLDSNPTKLLEVVEVGKQMLMTRGALTTFSIANDVAKYFAIIPAAFVATYPQLAALDVMGLHSPQSAILSAVIFNALIIVVLIPLALKGVRWRAESAERLLRRHLLIYGLGGLIAPFIGIKLIDMLLVALGLA